MYLIIYKLLIIFLFISFEKNVHVQSFDIKAELGYSSFPRKLIEVFGKDKRCYLMSMCPMYVTLVCFILSNF